jgi:hypothetical protein
MRGDGGMEVRTCGKDIGVTVEREMRGALGVDDSDVGLSNSDGKVGDFGVGGLTKLKRRESEYPGTMDLVEEAGMRMGY